MSERERDGPCANKDWGRDMDRQRQEYAEEIPREKGGGDMGGRSFLQLRRAAFFSVAPARRCGFAEFGFARCNKLEEWINKISHDKVASHSKVQNLNIEPCSVSAGTPGFLRSKKREKIEPFPGFFG